MFNAHWPSCFGLFSLSSMMLLATNQYNTLGGIRKETVWGLPCALMLVARPPRGIRYQTAHAPLLFRHMVIKLPWLPWWQEEQSSTAGCVSHGTVFARGGGGDCAGGGRLHISPKRPIFTRRRCHQQWRPMMCDEGTKYVEGQQMQGGRRATQWRRGWTCPVTTGDDRWRSRTATDLRNRRIFAESYFIFIRQSWMYSRERGWREEALHTHLLAPSTRCKSFNSACIYRSIPNRVNVLENGTAHVQ
jgi:hypothetical protein